LGAKGAPSISAACLRALGRYVAVGQGRDSGIALGLGICLKTLFGDKIAKIWAIHR
jgi:hypothetical protein